ncbi:hypothetical protein KXX45_005666, partial [Aspergillus fumigatus]
LTAKQEEIGSHFSAIPQNPDPRNTLPRMERKGSLSVKGSCIGRVQQYLRLWVQFIQAAQF